MSKKPKKKQAKQQNRAPKKAGSASKKQSPPKPTGKTKTTSTANTKPKQSKKPAARIEAEYPHFRRYKKSDHPTLIIGDQIIIIEDKDIEEYLYRKVMHAQKDGRHVNEEVKPNPNPADKKPMYIAKRVRHDDKEHFDEKPLPWKPE